jgi:GxxExxY protein
MGKDFPLKEETKRILGACFEVYNFKGCGFSEPVYQECMEIELELRDIPHEAQKSLGLEYKGRKLKKTFEPDLLCFDQVIVELKALKELNDEHRAQLMNYLKATGLEIGLLVNFGHYPGVQYERIIMSKQTPCLRKSALSADSR